MPGSFPQIVQSQAERLCEKWYNKAEEQGESERRWSNEETQLPQ